MRHEVPMLAFLPSFFLGPWLAGLLCMPCAALGESITVKPQSLTGQAQPQACSVALFGYRMVLVQCLCGLLCMH